jgi:hypothetical protein
MITMLMVGVTELPVFMYSLRAGGYKADRRYGTSDGTSDEMACIAGVVNICALRVP